MSEDNRNYGSHLLGTRHRALPEASVSSPAIAHEGPRKIRPAIKRFVQKITPKPFRRSKGRDSHAVSLKDASEVGALVAASMPELAAATALEDANTVGMEVSEPDRTPAAVLGDASEIGAEVGKPDQAAVAALEDATEVGAEASKPDLAAAAALEDANETAAHMNRLGSSTKSGAQATQNAPTALDDADNLQSTYLQPLKIFDSVISKIGDVHPYAKIALGVLSTASKIILAQDSRDEAVLRLLTKLDQVYSFVSQDDTLAQMSSMRTIVARIAQVTMECAEFIRSFAETKGFWTRLGKNVLSETNDKIQGYSDTLEGLMQQFRDQVTRDTAAFIHRADEFMDLNGIICASGAGLITGKRCLPNTRTEILAEISNWINSSGDDVPRVLWLSGPAGKGKSAIAHTVAGWFEN
ncbi:hypothetical protein BJ138DRAFT_1165211, partial [Hygrophoropsis aurantiaca]